MSYALRDYQQRQHDKALAAWGHAPWWDGEAQKFRSILLKQPTAGGKTITASCIIQTLTEKLGARCLFCGDTDELVRQPLEKLHKATGIIASLEKAEDRASLNAKVVVASVQTMCRKNRLERFPVDHFTHIFHDEAHEGPDRAAKVNERFPNAKLCALTATPFRINLASLTKWYEYVADELDLPELIEGGYIPPVKWHNIPLNIDVSGLKMSVTSEGKDVNAEDSDNRIIPWFEAIVKAILEREPHRFHVAFHGLCATSEKFVEVCNGNGLTAKHVDGDSPDRQEILEGFRQKHFHLLSNASLLRKGWDCDIADSLIPLRMTKSVGLIRQQAGRILRPLDGILNGLTTPQERIDAIAASAKPNAVIFDFLRLTEKAGLAGPASIFADCEEEAGAMQRIMKDRSEADLMEIRAAVQRDREEKLAAELEAQAKAQALQKTRAATLMDARQMALTLHDRSLEAYEPVFAWESGKISEKQSKLLEGIGVNPDSVMCRGMASKMLDAVLGREAAGLAAIEAFAPLRRAGVANPEKVTLEEAIKLLRYQYPCSWGKAHKGKPLCEVPRSFFNWLMFVAEEDAREACRKKAPSVWRYCTKVALPNRKTKTETQMELSQ